MGQACGTTVKAKGGTWIARSAVWLVGLSVVAFGGNLWAQADASITDSRTPPEVATGTPDGTYSLSHFDSYNGYNGSLTIDVPILNVGGRGSAGHTISVAINAPGWKAIIRAGEYPTILGVGAIFGGVPYNPGKVVSRVGWGSNSTPCGPNDKYKTWTVIESAVVTRITFTEPNGTQHELVDTKTNGQPIIPQNSPGAAACTQGFVGTDRGNTFRAMDGSGIVFVSDLPVVDPAGFLTQGGAHFGPVPCAGWVDFPDGTRYRVDNNSATGANFVSAIEDRNGNMISFVSDGSQIIDAANRKINITLANGTTGNNDVFSYQGFSGGETITVKRIMLDQALASNMQLQTCDQLFPGDQNYASYCNPSNATTNVDFLVIQSIALADGSMYRFDYNSYGEVADVFLPTGGRVSYSWPIASQFSSNCSATPTFCIQVFGDNSPAGVSDVLYRRLLSRTEYADGTHASHVTRYGYAYGATDQYGPTVTTATEQDGTGRLIAITKHHYFGDASMVDDLVNNLYYSYPEHGKETLTETIDPTTNTTVRQTLQAWAERPCLTTEQCWYVNAGEDFPHDYRVTSVQTTQGSKIKLVSNTYSNDLYNNVTDVVETDWGTGSVGATLRHTHTDYLQTGNIVNLPAETKVYDGGTNLFADTKFNYDETLGKESDAPGIVNHDSAYAAGTTIPRGNLTSQAGCLANLTASGMTSCSWITAHQKTYDIAGNVLTSTEFTGKDPKGNTTQFSYTDSYSDGTSRGSYAHVTQITNAAGQSANLTYDYNSGKAVSFKDPNQASTQFSYSDPFDRVRQIIAADGGKTNVTYDSPTQTTVTKD